MREKAGSLLFHYTSKRSFPCLRSTPVNRPIENPTAPSDNPSSYRLSIFRTPPRVLPVGERSVFGSRWGRIRRQNRGMLNADTFAAVEKAYSRCDCGGRGHGERVVLSVCRHPRNPLRG